MYIDFLFSYKVGIFYTDYQWAIDLLDQYYERLPKEIVTEYRRARNECRLTLKNGMYVQTMRADTSCRGSRFDIAIVQDTVDENSLNQRIRPMVSRRNVIVVDEEILNGEVIRNKDIQALV